MHCHTFGINSSIVQLLSTYTDTGFPTFIGNCKAKKRTGFSECISSIFLSNFTLFILLTVKFQHLLSGNSDGNLHYMLLEAGRLIVAIAFNRQFDGQVSVDRKILVIQMSRI